jgi:hypothetical protein
MRMPETQVEVKSAASLAPVFVVILGPGKAVDRHWPNGARCSTPCLAHLFELLGKGSKQCEQCERGNPRRAYFYFPVARFGRFKQERVVLTALEVPLAFWRSAGPELRRGQVVNFRKAERSTRLDWEILHDTAEQSAPPCFDLIAALIASDRIALPEAGAAEEEARVIPFEKRA